MKPLKAAARKLWYAIHNLLYFRTETFVGPAGKIKVWRHRIGGVIGEAEITVAGESDTIELLDIPEHTLKWLVECKTPDNLRVKAKMAFEWYGPDE